MVYCITKKQKKKSIYNKGILSPLFFCYNTTSEVLIMSYALITGASSGIGYEAAKKLNSLGYDLILVARRLDKLNELKELLKGDIITLSYDLSREDNIYSLIENIKSYDIKVFINNAGFGECGYIKETSLE